MGRTAKSPAKKKKVDKEAKPKDELRHSGLPSVGAGGSLVNPRLIPMERFERIHEPD